VSLPPLRGGLLLPPLANKEVTLRAGACTLGVVLQYYGECRSAVQVSTCTLVTPRPHTVCLPCRPWLPTYNRELQVTLAVHVIDAVHTTAARPLPPPGKPARLTPLGHSPPIPPRGLHQ
jgi:hypothetical protein